MSAFQQISAKRGVSASALRQWLQKSRRENRDHIHDIDLLAKNAQSREEVQELRGTVKLLQAASAFCLGSRSQASEMIVVIDQCRNRFSIEFICATFNKERGGGFLSSPGYRDARRRAPLARQVRDMELVVIAREIHAESYVVYGVSKMWHALKRRDVEIGREQTRQIMGLAGVKNERSGKTPVTLRKSRNVDARLDLVQRDFGDAA